MFWSTEKFPWMPLPLIGDSNLMFSLALVKFTSLTYVRLRMNSVAFITLSERMLSYAMLWLVPSDSVDSTPSHPPLELKTCEWSSLLMSNKLLLSIVLRAFRVAEWIMAVGNCFLRKINFPATNDLLIWYFSFLLLFRRLLSLIFYFLFVVFFFLFLVVLVVSQEAFEENTNFFRCKNAKTDNKSFSVVNNWDHW